MILAKANYFAEESDGMLKSSWRYNVVQVPGRPVMNSGKGNRFLRDPRPLSAVAHCRSQMVNRPESFAE
jgi:hypothetical protein